MKRRIFLAGSIVLLLAFTFLALSAQPGDVIVIDGADNLETNSLSGSTTLLNLLNSVADRITLQYSDLLKEIGLTAPPAALNTNLSAVADRVAMQYSDRARHLGLAAVPAALNARLNEVADRLVFQYANSNRRLPLAFPTNLIGDTTPPIIVGTPIASAGSGGGTISWSTDEFTTYVLRYGTNPGNYTNTVTGSLFQIDHVASLPGLSEGMYYFQIVSTDLSGNQSTSQEYSFVTQTFVYLPMIVR